MVQFYPNYESRFGLWSPVLRHLDDMLDVMSHTADPRTSMSSTQNLRFDYFETDELYIMNIDVPGVAREDLQVELEGNSLHLAGQRKHEGKSGARITSFSQRIHLPEGVQSEHIAADLKDGVLRLAIQKPAAQRPTKIKIGDGPAKGFLKNLLGNEKKTSETIDVKKSKTETVAISG